MSGEWCGTHLDITLAELIDLLQTQALVLRNEEVLGHNLASVPC